MGDLSAEPSMEDILSSIKRIISEEGDAPAPRSKRSAARPAQLAAVVSEPRMARETAGDEVLELNDPMPDPTPIGLSPTAAPVPPPAPAPEPAVAMAAAPAAAKAADPIVSTHTVEATRGALDALSRLLVKPEPGHDGTLEGMVREMLRPMLRDWLDANLPTLVEQIVAREIAKITGTAR